MDENYPPKILVRTWLKLIESDDITSIRRNLLEANLVNIFGSVVLAEIYLNEQTF
ncbi:hypothetical protein NBRC116600_33550 [Thalassotalea sp. SU-HH00458]